MDTLLPYQPYKQKIKLGDSFSEAFQLPFGIHQGFILDPFLFTLYTSPLSQLIPSFKVTNHLYADGNPDIFSNRPLAIDI